MTISDPTTDMLNRIRNAVIARHDSVLIPSSKVKLAIAKILKGEGFIKDYEVLKDKTHRAIKVYLKYGDRNQPVISGLERVSK
ncbi:MAG: 30S ribosomal protein S8, partial [Chloroflexi bacterium]|nr:30S ribosomal protein S8 [Chloroflexota bacterium]